MRSAGVVQVARLPFQAGDSGANPAHRLQFQTVDLIAANTLLASAHYLGSVSTGSLILGAFEDDVLTCCQVWRWPTARMLPSDGTWLELSRWCITSTVPNAGSQMMAWARRHIRRNCPHVTTLVSYSDIERHTGALYRASSWASSPTHIERRYDLDGIGYPSGQGSWDGITKQVTKRRWIIDLTKKGHPQ